MYLGYDSTFCEKSKGSVAAKIEQTIKDFIHKPGDTAAAVEYMKQRIEPLVDDCQKIADMNTQGIIERFNLAH